MKIKLSVNEQERELEVEPGELLLDALRTAGYLGVKRGCEAGTCGSCVVLVDGVPQFSCLLLAAAQQDRQITTIEALGSPEHPHPIMRAFAEEAGVQCGYCVPGMILSSKALLDADPHPDEAAIKTALDGHLCRCTGYVKQIAAVRRAAELMEEDR
jgi:aerobic-type carbon monoxide dehydrogenase small subunit (CoxS/CutS family)